MFITSINLGFLKEKKIIMIIITAITIACILIATTFYIVNKDSNGFNLGNVLNKDSIMDITSYFADYSITIQSNKNTNNYQMKEWYSKNEKNNTERFKFETLSANNEKISYLIENNQVKIKNESQKNEFYLSDYIVKKENIMSISTFIGIYKKIINGNIDNCCKIENVDEDQKISYKIIFGNNDCDICKEYSDLVKDGIKISAIELLINKDTSKPTEMFVYNSDNKVYIDISYNSFEINTVF